MRRTRRYVGNFEQNDGKAGVVYILVNDAFRSGLLKIGQSTRSGDARARDLNRTVGTETPHHFRCVFEERTMDCGRAEKMVHARLREHRLSRQEYFDVDLEVAKLAIVEECARFVVKVTPPPVLNLAPKVALPSITINQPHTIESHPPPPTLTELQAEVDKYYPPKPLTIWDRSHGMGEKAFLTAFILLVFGTAPAILVWQTFFK